MRDWQEIDNLLLKADIALRSSGHGGNPYHDELGKFTTNDMAHEMSPAGVAARSEAIRQQRERLRQEESKLRDPSGKPETWDERKRRLKLPPYDKPSSEDNSSSSSSFDDKPAKMRTESPGGVKVGDKVSTMYGFGGGISNSEIYGEVEKINSDGSVDIRIGSGYRSGTLHTLQVGTKIRHQPARPKGYLGNMPFPVERKV